MKSSYSKLILRTSISVLSTAILVLYGCITVPIPALESPPFDNDKLKSIEIGKTTRNDIEQLFGGFPSGSRREGKVYIYAKSQKLLYTETILYPGTNILHTVGKLHLLIIRFDTNSIVSEFDICGQGDTIGGYLYIANDGESDYVKGTSSFYHNQRWDTTYWDNFCIIYDQSTDKSAKTFQVSDEKASIYYFTNNPERGSIVCIDSMPASSCDIDGYLYWNVSPGRHTIGVVRPGTVTIVEQIHYYFYPGKIYFLQADGNTLTILDRGSGAAAIKKRTLIMDKLDLSRF